MLTFFCPKRKEAEKGREKLQPWNQAIHNYQSKFLKQNFFYFYKRAFIQQH